MLLTAHKWVSKRCLKCNAIIPEGQSRCPHCGGKRILDKDGPSPEET